MVSMLSMALIVSVFRECLSRNVFLLMRCATQSRRGCTKKAEQSVKDSTSGLARAQMAVLVLVIGQSGKLKDRHPESDEFTHLIHEFFGTTHRENGD